MEVSHSPYYSFAGSISTKVIAFVLCVLLGGAERKEKKIQ